MSTLSIQSPAGTSTSSSSVSAAGRAVAALNSPRMDDLSSNSDITRETSAESEQPVAANKTQEKKSSWFWSQWASQTGLFAPLVPEDSPEAIAERERQEQARKRQEKLESVHSWRPSQDNTTSPQKQRTSNPARPSMMKRLSSAVELKWWNGSDAAAQQEDVEEEDLQQRTRPRGISQGSKSLTTQQEDDMPDSSGDIQLR